MENSNSLSKNGFPNQDYVSHNAEERAAAVSFLGLGESDEDFVQVSLSANNVSCYPGGKSQDEKAQPEGKVGWKRFAGIIFGLSACLFFSLTTLCVKVLNNKNFHPLAISPYLFSGIMLPCVPIMLFYQLRKKKDGKGELVNIFSGIWPLSDGEKRIILLYLICRALLGCSSVFLRFYSLKYISLADSSVISHSSPVFVVIISHFVLKERCGVVSIVMALVTCIGVFIIFRPPILTGGTAFDTETLLGSLLASFAMITNALMFVVMRKLRQAHFSLLLFSFGGLGLLSSLVVGGSMGILQLPTGWHETLLALGVIPFMVFAGQISIILALKFENAGPVSLVRTCDVIFSFMWQYIFLSAQPDVYSFIGAMIVTIGVVVTTMRKWLSTLPEASPTRRRLRILLM